jgi:hypothetical protein
MDEAVPEIISEYTIEGRKAINILPTLMAWPVTAVTRWDAALK